MTKGQLALHLAEPHGRASNVTPLNELLKWSKHDLEIAHKHLKAAGPCPLDLAA